MVIFDIFVRLSYPCYLSVIVILLFLLFGFLHLFVLIFILICGVLQMQARAPSAPALHSTGPSPKETVSREVIEKTLEIRMGA